MQQYHIKQSSILNLFSVILYCLVLVAIGVFLHGMIILSGALGLLTALLFYRNQRKYKLLKSRDPTIVTLQDNTDSVELDDHQFEQYRVFSNRWFLILQMKNEQTGKNVMLVSDRFNTINEYLRFRYQIINMSKNPHVA